MAKPAKCNAWISHISVLCIATSKWLIDGLIVLLFIILLLCCFICLKCSKSEFVKYIIYPL